MFFVFCVENSCVLIPFVRSPLYLFHETGLARFKDAGPTADTGSQVRVSRSSPLIGGGALGKTSGSLASFRFHVSLLSSPEGSSSGLITPGELGTLPA